MHEWRCSTIDFTINHLMFWSCCGLFWFFAVSLFAYTNSGFFFLVCIDCCWCISSSSSLYRFFFRFHWLLLSLVLVCLNDPFYMHEAEDQQIPNHIPLILYFSDSNSVRRKKRHVLTHFISVLSSHLSTGNVFNLRSWLHQTSATTDSHLYI